VLECLVVLREVISPSKGALIRALVIAEILSYNHYIFLAAGEIPPLNLETLPTDIRLYKYTNQFCLELFQRIFNRTSSPSR
jgi:hypothetical protein